MDADADEEQVGEHEADAGENQTVSSCFLFKFINLRIYKWQGVSIFFKTNMLIIACAWQIDEVKKTETEIKEEKEEGGEVKSEDKTGATPDTDLLSTLASAALEQDPKDKNVGGKFWR